MFDQKSNAPRSGFRNFVVSLADVANLVDISLHLFHKKLMSPSHQKIKLAGKKRGGVFDMFSFNSIANNSYDGDRITFQYVGVFPHIVFGMLFIIPYLSM